MMTNVALAATYSRTLYGKKMILRAPVITPIKGGVIASSGKTTKKRVYFMYEDQVFWANRVVFKYSKIYLQRGFWGNSRRSTLTGKDLIYNLKNNFFDGDNIEVTSGLLKINTGRLSFYGKRIEFTKAQLGLTFIDIGLRMDSIQIFPGWVVMRNLSFGTAEYDYYRIPAWVVDMRRNAFKMPYPLPEGGSTIYRGNFLLLNTHYYFNEHLYGFARIGSSQYKGPMAGVGQIIRFDDKHQLYLGVDSWQWVEPQIKAEYNYSFMKLPYKKRRPTFGELLEYNKKVNSLNSSDLRATYTKREVVNDEEIDRDMEFGYTGHFSLTKRIGMDLTLASGRIYEYSTEVDAIRTNSDYLFSYMYPLGWFDPMWWGLGYNRSDYDLKPFTWQRVYGTVGWEKDWRLFLLGIKYTHYFHDKGGSPFLFDEKYVNSNNIVYNVRFGSRNHHLGAKFLTDTRHDILVDTTYYMGWAFRGWVLQMSYSTQREAFALGAAMELF